MKKKPTYDFAEKFNALGKVIAAVLACTLALTLLMQVDAPANGQNDEPSERW